MDRSLQRDRTELFLAGEWIRSTRPMTVINPATEEPLAVAPCGTADDANRAVTAARRVADARSWSRLGQGDRAAILDRALMILRPALPDVAELVTAETGTPITASKMLNVHAAPAMWSYISTLGRTYERYEMRGAHPEVLVIRDPVGVVAAIAPCNTPFLQAVHNVLYPLAAGCSVVFKPAPESPLDALVLAEALAEADLPAGVLSILLGDAETDEALVRHPGVDRVAFTGTTAVGRRIAGRTPEALKRTTLELGGQSVAIVLDDADLEAAVPALVEAALANSGQVCTTTVRLLVKESVHDELVDRLRAALEKTVVGDPMDPVTELGPLVTQRQRDSVARYIEQGVRAGGRIVTGGGRPANLPRGWFIEPTLLDNIDNRSAIAHAEVFGPVVTVTTVADDQTAIDLANDSALGLHAAVYTSDPVRARKIVEAVRSGVMRINGCFENMRGNGCFNNVRGPMGEARYAALGRQGGREGFDAFFELKTVHNPSLIR